MKNLEIEKKFLLKPCNVKNLVKKNCLMYEKIKIEQFYLPKNEENIKIRYRKEGSKYLKTIKKGEGLVREESEVEVSKDEYLSFLNKRDGNIIKKDRYEICLNSKNYQVDVFKGYLEGLYTLEIEFENKNEALEYKIKKPFKKIILKDLTDIKYFSNSNLSTLNFVEALECLDGCKILKPTNCVKELLQCYFKNIINTILENKEAILQGDKDIEKLHQFRVAIRRTRVILSIFVNIFNDDLANELNDRLKDIMQKSNAKRDLDVYLGVLDKYEKNLPKKLKGAMTPFKEKLLLEQKNQESKIIELLNSSELKKAIEKLSLLANGNSYYKNEAKEMIIVFATKEIMKLSKKIKKDINKLSLNDSNEKYHKIRIEFKKLRYISELFKDIIDIKGFYKFINKLKKMQTVLGEHQDLVVQFEHIKNFEKMENLYNKNSKEAIKYLKKYIKKKVEDKKEQFFKDREKFVKVYKKAFYC